MRDIRVKGLIALHLPGKRDVAIGANVPVKELVGWLAELGAALVLEFPTRQDPMVQKLLAAKRAGLHMEVCRITIAQVRRPRLCVDSSPIAAT